MNIVYINNEILINNKVINAIDIEQLTENQFLLNTDKGSVLLDLTVSINDNVYNTINDFAQSLNVVIKQKNRANDLQLDKDFGNILLDEFLKDNRILPVAFTPSISLQLLQTFAPIKALAEVGDIKNVKAILSTIPTDNIYTQERKDKYIQMCNNHLGI